MDIKSEFFARFHAKSDKLKFTFHLPKHFVFYTEWKVGIKSFELNADFVSNLSVEDRTIRYKTKANYTWETILLPQIGFDSISKLSQCVSNSSPNILKLKFDSSSNFLTIEVGSDFEVQFSDLLSSWLHIPLKTIITDSMSYYLTTNEALQTPKFGLLCDICDASVQNNIYQRNLFSFSLNKNWSLEGVQKDLQILEYHSLSSNQFGCISFELEQIAGQKVKSLETDIMLTLHFIKN